MEEERNEINEDEKEIVKALDEEYLNLKRSNNKKNAIIIVLVFVLIILLALVLLYYFNNKDEKQGEGTNPISTSTPIPSTPDPTEKEQTSTPEPVASTLSNDEAIKIAKEKLKKTEILTNEFDNTCFNGKDAYGNTEGTMEDMFCFFDTLDNFKKTFYNIYSSKLEYKDVLFEFKFPGETHSTNLKYEGDFGNIPGYAIKDKKVYTRGCTIGSGVYSRMDKFSVASNSSNTIKLNYVVMAKDPDIEDAKEYEYEKTTMTLVKEDGDWKILNATIVDMCNGVYKVGKES